MLRLLKISLAVFFAFFMPFPAFTQTFHGAVAGTVTDSQGAVISDAAVQLVNPATRLTLNAKSSKSGDFSFPELSVGTYQLTVSYSGFATKKIQDVDVAVTKVTNVKVELSIGSESTVIDVAAEAIQTDTTSSALVSVIDSKSVQEMPMNGRNFTQMVKFSPGAGALTNSINGSRTASINFQVDGADNVDPWLGIVASNQGGIAGVAGGLIPIEAIDQFSMQSGGEADQGRNAGANSNMVIKSGTNNLHGDVFYFDRNEYFAAISPVAPVGSRKALIRNHQGGFTLGGPIWKDRTFFFVAGEIQIAKANTAVLGTAPSDAWMRAGSSFLGNWGINQGSSSTLAPNANQLSNNLYGLLYPANSKGGTATTQNYFANGTSNYNSFNGIIKLDHKFSDKQTLSARYLGTTGKQTAPTTSDYADYFQTAPMHIHNYSVVHNYIFTPRVLNQVTLGTNYFLQTFNDANQGFYPQKNAGLNVGLTDGTILAAGSPTINITGFETVGATQPSGRTDVTGHVTDNLHWTVGRHELKFGGEFRHSNVNQLYFSSARGTFAFDGTRGPWYLAPSSANTSAAAAARTACSATGSGPACVAACAVAGACSPGTSPNALATQYCTNLGIASCTNLSTLSDFLNGTPSNSSGARLLQGNAQRVWTLNTYDLWVQDNFKITKQLNLNYGVRYTVPGVIHAEKDDIYQFVPGATPGFVKGYYPNYYSGFAPRVGFSYSPFDGDRTVIRGSYGLFYDFPAMSSWITGTTTNGGANYAQNNPAGPDAAAIFNQTNVKWQVSTNPFAGASAPQVGAYGVNQNFKMPRSSVVSINVENQLSKTTLFTVGYVGTFGRHLEVLYNINQPVASGTTTTGPRPYDTITSYPNQNPTFAGKPLLAINQLNFGANSNFHSLQTTIKQAAWKGLIATFNYTWSKSLDYASSNTTPMNSYNLKADYGPSTFDNRHVLNGYVYYNLPKFTDKAKRITQGYQVNALLTFTTGTPISPQYTTNVDGTGELKNRPNWNGQSPYVGGVQLATSGSTGRTYRQLSTFTTVFSTPTTGTYGNLRRDNFSGPSFKTVDLSLFKRTPITERISSELRAEIFNVLNLNNFANPTVNPTSSSFGIITNTRNASSAPGLGVGEPFNIQFAAKLSF
jgi:hypothetical protein